MSFHPVRMKGAKVYSATRVSLLLVVTAAIGLISISAQKQFASAQYGGGGGEGAPLSEEQLAFCEQHQIQPCTETNILAKQRLLDTQNTQYGNAPEGSGTAMLSTGTTEMAVFIGVLGAIFGGVAAVFFFKGRGAKPPEERQ
jgi:hypothetical protein